MNSNEQSTCTGSHQPPALPGLTRQVESSDPRDPRSHPDRESPCRESPLRCPPQRARRRERRPRRRDRQQEGTPPRRERSAGSHRGRTPTVRDDQRTGDRWRFGNTHDSRRRFGIQPVRRRLGRASRGRRRTDCPDRNPSPHERNPRKTPLASAAYLKRIESLEHCDRRARGGFVGWAHDAALHAPYRLQVVVEPFQAGPGRPAPTSALACNASIVTTGSVSRRSILMITSMPCTAQRYPPLSMSTTAIASHT